MRRFALALLILAHSAFADLSILGTWSNPGGTFTFFSNGQCQIAWIQSGQYVTGTWELTGEMLNIKTEGAVMQFEVTRDEKYLILKDGNGQYVFQSAVAPPASKD